MAFRQLIAGTGCFLLATLSSAQAQSTIPQLPWDVGHPERKPWSRELLAQVRSKLASFDRAEDVAAFCPRYKSLDPGQRAKVFAVIAVAIAKFESNYNPKQHFHEPPPLGYDSIGLFQLSYEDGFPWCKLDPRSKSLENPIINIQCAVPEMARLVRNDSRIAAGSSAKTARGLARYWSVVRTGPKHHLNQIRNAARSLTECT